MKRNVAFKIFNLTIILLLLMTSISYGAVERCTDHVCAGNGDSAYAQGHGGAHLLCGECEDDSHEGTAEMYCWTCADTTTSGTIGWHSRYCTICGLRKGSSAEHNTINACPECGVENLSCSVCGHTVIHRCVSSGTLSAAVAPTLQDVSLQYDGLGHTIVMSGGSGGVIYFNTSNSVTGWKRDITRRTQVGTTTIYAFTKGDSTHDDSEVVSATITITRAPINPVLSFAGYIYGDTLATPSVTGNTGSGTVEYYYRESGETSWTNWNTVTSSTYLPAGNYNMYAHINQTTNYSSADTSIINFTVSKGNVVPVISMTGYTYGGTKSTPELVSGNPGNGTVTYYYNTTNSNQNGITWASVTDSKTLDAGNYYMYASIAATAEYGNLVSEPVMFTISKSARTAANNALPAVTVSDYNYEGTPMTPYLNNNLENGSVSYYYTTENSNATGTAWQNINGTTLNSGEYYMFAEVGATTNYLAGKSEPVKFTVYPHQSVLPTITSFEGFYDGNAHTISVGSNSHGGTVYYSSDDENWTTTPETFTEIGDYDVYVKVVGDANHSDTEEQYAFVCIRPNNIESGDLTVSYGSTTYTYSGDDIEPAVTVSKNGTTLVKDTDYEVYYFDNRNVGTATIAICGINNYTGNVNRQFTITPATLTITAQSLVVEHGEEIPNPQFVITGSKGTDIITLSGDYETEATSSSPIGNYPIRRGTLAIDPAFVNPNNYTINYIGANITIIGKSVSGEEMICNISPLETIYNGKNQTVDIELYSSTNVSKKLVEGVDFNTSYSPNKNVGTVTVTISGIANYSGSFTRTFNILPRTLRVQPDNLSKNFGESDPPVLTYTYTNNADGEVPVITGTLIRASGEVAGDYEIYRNNLALGSDVQFSASNYVMEFVEGIMFSIDSASASRFNVTLSQYEYSYDGNAHMPTVTVVDSVSHETLVRGLNYTVEYIDNINVGTATVRVSGINDYHGDKDVTFEIKNSVISGSVSIVDASIRHYARETLYSSVNVTPLDTTLKYQWYKSEDNTMTNGAPIEGATRSSLYITDDLTGYYVYVVVTATKPNFTAKTFKDTIQNEIWENEAPRSPIVTAKVGDSTGPNYVSGTWVSGDVWIHLQARDNYEVWEYSYSTESATSGFAPINPQGASEVSMLIDRNTNNVTYYFRCMDKFGNYGDTSSIVVSIDKDLPSIQDVTLSTTNATNNGVTVTGTATDAFSGVNEYLFGPSLNGTFSKIGPDNNIEVSTVYNDNVSNYYFAVKDRAGNITSTTFSVNNIDKVNPTLNIVSTKSTSSITYDVTVSDADSGINKLTLNGNELELYRHSNNYEASVTLTNGGDYEFIVYDNAGNKTTQTKSFYNINYSPNGINGTIAGQIKEQDETVTIKSCELTNPDYTFVKWNTSGDGTGTNYNPGDNYSANSSLTLYAIWTQTEYLLDRVALNSYEISYNGEAVFPVEKVYNNFGKLLLKEEDYTIECLNNINVGSATLIIRGKNKYEGQSLSTSFSIAGESIDDANITLSNLVYAYDGYSKKPVPEVKFGGKTLVRGRDYSVAYRDNINSGAGKVVIKGEGRYYGERIIEFTITPASRNTRVYNVGLIRGEKLELQFAYDGPISGDTLVSSNQAVATIEKTLATYYINGVNAGHTTLTFNIPESDNYEADEKIIQVTVFETSATAKPVYGTVVIDKDAEKTSVPRVVLGLRASCADYMYISTSNTTPTANSSDWMEYSTGMPFEFDNANGTKNIYVWFKDENGNISEVATDDIVLDSNYEYPAHDSIMLDKTEVDKMQPQVKITNISPSGATMKVSFKQKDMMINDTRSGVDFTTIKYGYKKLEDEGTYTWVTDDVVYPLELGKQYLVATQAYDRAGNGPTVSDAYIFTVPIKYTTTITLPETNAPCDGLTHEIERATVEKIADIEPTGTITYTYYEDAECNIPTRKEVTGSAYVGGPPSRAGTYYVIASLSDDPNYHNCSSEPQKLHLGWYLDKNSDDTQNVFAYIQETATGSGKYELVVVGDGSMKDLDEILAKDPSPSNCYWADYKDDITRLTIGDSHSHLNNIGAGVFSGLTAITAVDIPDTVTIIGDNAFAGDTHLTGVITIPASTETIGNNPFAETQVTGFLVQFGNSKYDSIDGVLVTKNHKSLISYPAGSTTRDYEIPESILYIKAGAFEGSNYLESVIIPEGVIEIESEAFHNCPRLSRIEIYDLKDESKSYLNKIGDDAFTNIANNSEIYTFSGDVAKKLVKERMYDEDTTKVYWPPTIKLDPVDMNGGIGYTVKFIVTAEPGYVEDLYFEWHKQTTDKIRPGQDPAVSSGITTTPTAKSSEYQTATLSASDSGDRYYAVAYNMPYYRTKGYTHSKSAQIIMLEHANYRVERRVEVTGTTNYYYFETLQKAFDFAVSGDTVHVLQDVNNEQSAVLRNDKTVTLNNEGFAINMANTGSVIVNSGTSLNIAGNGTINKSANSFVIENSGTITINNSEFKITNTAGPGINLNEKVELTLNSGTIETSGTAIHSQSANIKLTSANARIVVNSTSNVSAVELLNYAKFEMTNGQIQVTSTTESLDKVVGIYNDGKDDVNSGKGRVTISGGSITVTGNGSQTGDAIRNVGSSDVIITGGTLYGTRSGIENTRTNRFGDTTITGGAISGGFIGVLNNAESAKVVIGTKDKDVHDDSPEINGGKYAIVNASKNDTVEIYDGILRTETTYNAASNSNIIYECINNSSLSFDSSNTDMIYIENGRGSIKTEDGYALYARTIGSNNTITLSTSSTPTVAELQNVTVEEGTSASFKIVFTDPGFPPEYEYEWQVSVDGGQTWSKVTTGVGINSDKYSTPPTSLAMDGNMYRCKITNLHGSVYTNHATIHVSSASSSMNQNPSVRISYANDIMAVGYDNPSDIASSKYVSLQIVIKSFAELNNATMSYGSNNYNLLTIGNSGVDGLFEIDYQEFTNELSDEVTEYNYVWNMKAYQNGAITVKAEDVNKRNGTATHTIDVIFDIDLKYEKSELNDSNNRLQITFYANKLVAIDSSYQGNTPTSDYLSVKSLNGLTYSYTFTYTPTQAMPQTRYYFTDEYNNKAYIDVEEILRIAYRDIKFTGDNNLREIDDMSVIEAYNVAQKLEAETELSDSQNVQSRYGLSQVQTDMFMARARDIGAAEMLTGANSSMAFDGFYIKDVNATQSANSVYNYGESSRNNFVAAVSGSNNELASENANYVDTISDASLYRGADISDFREDDVLPYMYEDTSGRAVNIGSGIQDASFRAVIVGN